MQKAKNINTKTSSNSDIIEVGLYSYYPLVSDPIYKFSYFILERFLKHTLI
jgi:hypothetical protein